MRKHILASSVLIFAAVGAAAARQDNTAVSLDSTEVVQMDSLALHLTANEPSGEKPYTPPSPKAQAFIRYGDYPVSYYTGLVDISIPVYTIKTSWIEVPVTFKYHASGLRYDDMSMEAGLGWDMIAGGVVTHTVRGANDNENAQKFAKDALSVQVITEHETIGDDYNSIRYVYNGALPYAYRNHSLEIRDGEADWWQFSFPGHSGNFFHDIQSSGWLTIPRDGLKLAGIAPPTFIDTEGNTFCFNVKDTQELSDSGYEEWFLGKITSASGKEEISFHYDYPTSIPGLVIHKPYISSCYIRTEEGVSYENIYTGTAGTTLSRPPRLTRIDFPSGYMTFNYKIIAEEESWSLDNVKIFSNASSSPFLTVSLTKGAFDNGQDRLDGISFAGNDGESYCYAFEYNGDPPSILQNGHDRGIDYWGYFNGAPVDIQSDYMPVHPRYNNRGCNREPDESYMMKGMLNKIIYPTKGYTEFEYEAHKWQGVSKLETYGGLRIKEIRNYLKDGSLAGKRWFRYGFEEDGKGEISWRPSVDDFTQSTMDLITTDNEIHNLQYKIKSYVTISSMPVLSDFQSGSSTVYPYVTEYTGDGTDTLSKTVYRFTYEPDELMPGMGMTFRAGSTDRLLRNNSWKSGILRSVYTYKKENGVYKTARSVDYTFNDINTAEFRNLRTRRYVNFIYEPYQTTSSMPDYDARYIDYPYYNQDFNKPSIQNPSPYDYYNYYYTTGLRLPVSKVESADGVSSVSRYEYNSLGFITKETRISGNKDSTVTYIRHVSDETTGYSAMKDKNIISPPTYERTVRNGNMVSEKNTTYTNSLSTNNSLFAVSHARAIYGSDIDAGTIDVVYHKYDEHGNPTYMTRQDGLETVLIWSYGNAYPVILIENASYSQVTAVLGSNLISSLSADAAPSDSQLDAAANTLRQSLPDAMVTSYTYRPMTGITSTTDPSGRRTTYDYDSLGRLVAIYDEDGNPLEKYEYNYSD